MAYIDLSYYKTTFLGTDPGDDTVLTRLIARASDLVDLMTDNKSQNYDNLPGYQQEAIQKATAYQTEFMVENGDTFSDTAAASERIGSWSISGAGGSDGQQVYSKPAIAYLEQNDLICAIIGVTDETDII